MTVFNLIKNGYDTYSMSLQGVFGWGSVIFCAVVAIIKQNERSLGGNI
jgi:NSS family neurotransmitter:Na+ symporter